MQVSSRRWVGLPSARNGRVSKHARQQVLFRRSVGDRTEQGPPCDYPVDESAMERLLGHPDAHRRQPQVVSSSVRGDVQAELPAA